MATSWNTWALKVRTNRMKGGEPKENSFNAGSIAT